MSNFDEKLVDRIKRLEREVERLRVKQQPKTGIYPDTYFDDLQYSLVGQRLTSPSAHITYSASYTQVNLQKTCDWNDDWLAMTVQMSHRWKLGTVVYPHLHWRQDAAAMPNLIISYIWQVNGAAQSSSWTHIAHSANAYTWSTGNLNQITKFGSITPPEGAGLSDIIFFKIMRDVANESMLFTGAEVDVNVQDDVYASSFDIHFEVDSAGSDTEYAK